jgi:hypothetical protein
MAGGSLSSKNKLLANYNEAEPPLGSASFFSDISHPVKGAVG